MTKDANKIFKRIKQFSYVNVEDTCIQKDFSDPITIDLNYYSSYRYNIHTLCHRLASGFASSMCAHEYLIRYKVYRPCRLSN